MLVLEKLLQEILQGDSGDRMVVVSNSTKASLPLSLICQLSVLMRHMQLETLQILFCFIITY